MGRYLEREIKGNEKIIYSAELHWIVYHFGLTTTIFGAFLGHYGSAIAAYLIDAKHTEYISKPLTYAAMFIIFVGALHLFFGFLRQISTELVITNRRVIAKYGFISTTTYELMLSKVEGANIDQTVLGRLLGYGTVMVKGTGGGISPIDHVADPYRFHRNLMQTLETIHHPEEVQENQQKGAHD